MGRSECPAGQLQTNASPHHTGRQQGQQVSVHSSLPQLQYTNPEGRAKSSKATTKISVVFKSSETVQQAVCIHTENQLCPPPSASGVSTNTDAPQDTGPSSPVLAETEVGSVLFSLVNSVLSAGNVC